METVSTTPGTPLTPDGAAREKFRLGQRFPQRNCASGAGRLKGSGASPCRPTSPGLLCSNVRTLRVALPQTQCALGGGAPRVPSSSTQLRLLKAPGQREGSPDLPSHPSPPALSVTHKTAVLPEASVLQKNAVRRAPPVPPRADGGFSLSPSIDSSSPEAFGKCSLSRLCGF